MRNPEAVGSYLSHARVCVRRLLLVVALTGLPGAVAAQPPIMEFPVPTAQSGLNGITAGPDGNVWFVERAANKIGRITPAGTITEFPVPSCCGLLWITAGPDGNIWFTEALASGNEIGRITPVGTVTEFPVRAHT